MKNKLLYTILFSLLLAFLFLPMIQEHYSIFKVNPLKGHTKPIDFPELTYESYSEGKFQGKLEQYISENFRFRETVIRIYNQYVWTFYNKTYVSFLVPGKDKWLYYFGAVKDYYGTEQHSMYRSTKAAKEYYDKNIDMMCELRKILKKYDIEFLSFMAPSKVRVYPEYLPDWERDSSTINPIEYYSKAFTEVGFPNIEMTSWFQIMKDTLGYPVFPQMDNHWQFTAVYAYDSLFRFMDSLKDFGIPKIKYGTPEPIEVKFQDDEASLNLLFPVKNKIPDYKLNVEVISDSTSRKPKVLFVGDSFIWGLTKFLPWKELMDDVEIWFYNEDVYDGFSKTPYRKSEINILEGILDADYIVFYSTGHQWYKATYGFVEEALEALKDEDAIRIAQTINIIKKDDNWVDALRIQSSIQGKSFNDIITIEANNVINNDSLLRDMTDITEEQIFNAKVNELVRKWRLDPSMIQYLKDKAKTKNKDFEVVIYEDARWVIRQEQNKK